MNNVNKNQTRDWLLAEFEKMKAKNSRITLRAMARRLDLPPGRLSEYFSGKRRVSKKVAVKIADRLGLDPRGRLRLIETTLLSKSGSHVKPEYHRLELDQFSVISSWHHYAILSLMETRDFQPSELWIAQRLGISILEVKAAINRLVRVGLVRMDGEKWISSGKNIETPTDIISAALKSANRQKLELALAALVDVPIEKRDFTSMTMAVDVSRLPEAKKRIAAFRKEIAAFLEGGSASEVYCLNLQLLPLSKNLKQKKGVSK